MRRRHQRVRLDEIVRMAEIVRDEEDEIGEDHQEAGQRQPVLHGEVGMEGQGVLLGLDLDADRVVGTRNVQRPDVEHHDAGDHERHEVVERVEAVQRGVADRIAAPQPDRDGITHDRDGGEQRGDDLGAPEAHLAPRQHVAHEGRRHHQQENDEAEDPQHLARLLV